MSLGRLSYITQSEGKMKKIGFIGCGKMASAIIKGLINTGFAAPSQILATQIDEKGLEEKSKELSIEILLDNKALAQRVDVIFLAVKPNQIVAVLEEIKPYVTSEKLVVSIAAGISTKKLAENLPLNSRIIRVMPNTPALVGEGMSAIFGGDFAMQNDVEYVQSLLSSIGKCIILESESQMDIVTAISGSGPAFFYKVINDIARAGEKLGMEYEKALLLSIQTAIGSAKMALNRDISMEELVSNVATKGGCTRVGVDVMEEKNIDNIFDEVIAKTSQKAHELGE